MISLGDLWAISLALSAFALLIMACLVVARFVTARQQSASQVQRNRLLPLLLGHASDAEILELRRQGPDMLGSLTSELIALVRGEDKAELVATATRLEVPDAFRRRLKGGSTRARMTAVEVLGHFPDDHCTAALEEALNDRDAGVRLAAALALASSGRAPHASLLVDRLRLGTDEHSMLIVTLLAEIARERPDEVRALIEGHGVPSPVRAAAIEALANSGDYTLVGVISELALAADDQCPELPRYLRALATFQHPGALPAISRCLASSVWWVRAAAAEAAGRICLGETSEALHRLLDDENWWVRFRAGEGLVRLGQPGQRLLAEVSRSGSDRARNAARLTLAEQAIAA